MYELLIIGGGPAGVAAGIYGARKKIESALITESFGGQSLVSNDIQNWIGTKSVSGFDLGKMLEEHLRAQEGLNIIDGEVVASVKDEKGKFVITTQSGKTFESKFLFLASGSRRKKLNVPGEAKLDGKGVVYCSTCDAPLFKNKTVAVIGGGNSGLEAVGDLLPYAAKISLLEYSDAPKGDPITLERIKKSEKFTLLTNAQVMEVVGNSFVTGVKYKDHQSGEVKELKLEGVFVEIGAVPNSEFVKSLVETNKLGEVVVDHKTQRTSHPRIWAAGDVSDVLYKQNNISAGDAVKAVLNIYEELQK